MMPPPDYLMFREEPSSEISVMPPCGDGRNLPVGSSDASSYSYSLPDGSRYPPTLYSTRSRTQAHPRTPNSNGSFHTHSPYDLLADLPALESFSPTSHLLPTSEAVGISTGYGGVTPMQMSTGKQTHGHYTNTGIHYDYNQLSAVMLQLPFLSSSMMGYHTGLYEGNSSTVDVRQDLFGPTPALVFPADPSGLTRESLSSRTWLDVMAADPLLGKQPRRGSPQEDQLPDSVFRLASDVSTPDARSPAPSSSFISSHSSASQEPCSDSDAAAPVLRHRVGSHANVRAARQRRKRNGRFQCDLCRATFTARHNLKNHENAHAGIRPYACPHCPGTFTTSSTAARHSKACKASLRPM